jgi:hypothetical protein
MTSNEIRELEKTLKPCPWCGEQPTLEILGDGYYTIYCQNDDCKAAVEVLIKGTPQDAARIWNERKE